MFRYNNRLDENGNKRTDASDSVWWFHRSLESGSLTRGDWQGGRNAVLIRFGENEEEKLRGFFRLRVAAARIVESFRGIQS
jgi:hypothetical protein